MNERKNSQQPQCGFGLLNLSCNVCGFGPCRINPFGPDDQKTICGASRDTIVAWNFLRDITDGSITIFKELEKLIRDFKESIRQQAFPEPGKEEISKCFENLLAKFRKETDAITLSDLLLKFLLEEKIFVDLLESLFPEKILEEWKEKNILPSFPSDEIFNGLLRANFGVSSDPLHLIIQALRCSIVGLGCSMLLYRLKDLIYGSPVLREGYIGLGTLSGKDINIVVKELPIALANQLFKELENSEIEKYIQEKEVKKINIVGLGAFGLDLLIRNGIPCCGGALDIEQVISTGRTDLVILDELCNLFSISDLTKKYSTKFLSFSPLVEIEHVEKIDYVPKQAKKVATDILRLAVESYKRRKELAKFHKEKSEVRYRVSVKCLKELTSDEISLLARTISEGHIKGIVLLVGCEKPPENVKDKILKFVEKLVENNILVLCSGCWVYSVVDSLLMAGKFDEKAGEELKKVCKQLGILPVTLLGSCTELGRGLELFVQISKDLKVDLNKLPFAVMVINYINNLVLNLGVSGATIGVTSFVSSSKALSSNEVLRILQDEVESLTGGRIIFEADADKVFETLFDLLLDKSDLLAESI